MECEVNNKQKLDIRYITKFDFLLMINKSHIDNKSYHTKSHQSHHQRHQAVGYLVGIDRSIG